MNNISMEEKQRDHAAARDWAREMVAHTDYLILDTETTGLGPGAEILQIAVCDARGRTLFNATVKPKLSIPIEASNIHGIDDAMVEHCPSFAEIYWVLKTLLSNREVIIYNADFDGRMLEQTCAQYDLPMIPFNATCAMLPYSSWVGEWNDQYGNYRFQKLPGGDHTAIGDVKATWRLIRTMAEIELQTIAA